jgi:hypothetical protein
MPNARSSKGHVPVARSRREEISDGCTEAGTRSLTRETIIIAAPLTAMAVALFGLDLVRAWDARSQRRTGQGLTGADHDEQGRGNECVDGASNNPPLLAQSTDLALDEGAVVALSPPDTVGDAGHREDREHHNPPAQWPR